MVRSWLFLSFSKVPLYFPKKDGEIKCARAIERLAHAIIKAELQKKDEVPPSRARDGAHLMAPVREFSQHIYFLYV